jgi:hypothetical protein
LKSAVLDIYFMNVVCYAENPDSPI